MVLKKISESPINIDLNEAKTFFRIIGNEEDALIQHLLEVAAIKAEQITNRSLSVTEYELYLNCFKDTKLPRPPFSEVLEVCYFTDTECKDYTDYRVTVEEYPTICFGSTPSDYKAGKESVIVRYKAGYTELPAPIKQWILVYALTLYENRENITINASVDTSIGEHYNHLLDSYRIIPCE